MVNCPEVWEYFLRMMIVDRVDASFVRSRSYSSNDLRKVRDNSATAGD